MPVDTIKKILNGMQHSKLNVLHWHITDGVSFPLEIKEYPDLIHYTTWNDQYYSKNDVLDIVNYAKLFGIRYK